jgi:hypothetical protein
MAPLVVMVFWIGFYPNPLLVKMHASVNELIEHVDVADFEMSQEAPELPPAAPAQAVPVTDKKQDRVRMRDYTSVPPIVR